MIDSAGALIGVMVIAIIITVYKKRKLAS